MSRSALSYVLLSLSVAACTGETGADGAGFVASTTDEPAGANCAAGGSRFDYGADDNGNGTLDPSEIDGTSYFCNGDEGVPTLVKTTPVGSGVCVTGGTLVEFGADDNRNGVLDPTEVDGSSAVCAGARSLVTTTQVGSSVECPAGAVQVDVGLDDNNNGTLDAGEIDDTELVCNGSAGGLVNVLNEDPGNNCVVGGYRIDHGADDNGDGTLDAGEVDGSRYLCDAGRFFVSSPGAPSTTNRSAGNGCGTQVTVGGTDVVARRLGSMTNMTTAGNQKFAIFDHTNADALVFTTNPKAFAADAAGATFKYSDSINFTLVAGRTYCIVMLADVGGTYSFDNAANASFGLTSVVSNPNALNFATPTLSGHASADCNVSVLTY